MDSLKFLIVEDDFYIARNLKKQIKSIGYEVTAIASSSIDAIRAFNENKPDFIIMDIELPESNDAGIQLAKNFRSRDEGINIIYFTSHIEESELMTQAIETAPDGILSKKASIQQLLVNINNCIRKRTHALEGSEIRKDDKSFWIKTNDTYIRIFFDDVSWFRSQDKMVKIFTDKREMPISFSSTLTYLVEEQLNIGFFVRTHKSYIININKAFNLDRSNDRTIMVSREKEKGGAAPIPISNTYFENLLKHLNIINTRNND